MRFGALIALAGVVSVAQAENNSSPAIQMPPFLVEEAKPDGIDWIYGNAGDLQVLSGCGTGQTQGFIDQIRQQRDRLGSFIPKEFLFKEILPETIILYPKSKKQDLDDALKRELDQGGEAASSRFVPMNDLRLSDADSSYIFIVFDDTVAKGDIWVGNGKVHPINYPTPVRSPAYLRFLLEARVPELPEWYVTGATRLYESKDFAQETAANGVSPDGSVISGRGESFEPDPWLSTGDSRALGRHPEAARPLVPLSELFVARYPAGKGQQYRDVWDAEAELFVRWCLSGAVDGGDERLRHFVEGAAIRPTNEAFFESCFGINYDDALESLSDYLPRAVSQPFTVPSDEFANQTEIDLRSATPEEIRRIKAEWSRRVLAATKADHPAQYAIFLQRVRQSLENAYAGGDRDSGFLATMALFRIQNDVPPDGAGLLEGNARAAASRPLTQVELAQAHFTDALTHPAGANGGLSTQQATRVIHEIAVAVRNGPIDSAYRLAAEVYAHMGRNLTPAEMTPLVDGARLYPRDSALVLDVAALELRAGRFPDGIEILDRGIWEASDPAEIQSFEKLRDLAIKANTAETLPARAPSSN